MTTKEKQFLKELLDTMNIKSALDTDAIADGLNEKYNIPFGTACDLVRQLLVSLSN